MQWSVNRFLSKIPYISRDSLNSIGTAVWNRADFEQNTIKLYISSVFSAKKVFSDYIQQHVDF